MAILPAIGAAAGFLFFQPSPSALRSIFEEGLARRRDAYGVYDVRTAQAARDLGLFLSRHGAEPDARNVLDQVVRIDERLFGAADPRTLADVAELQRYRLPTPPNRSGSGRRNRATPPSPPGRWINSPGFASRRTTAPAPASLYRKALAKQEEAGKDTAAVALALNALAKVVEPGEASRSSSAPWPSIAVYSAPAMPRPRRPKEPCRPARRNAAQRGGGPARCRGIGRFPRNGRHGSSPYRGRRQYPGLRLRSQRRSEAGRADVPIGARHRPPPLRTGASADPQRRARPDEFLKSAPR